MLSRRMPMYIDGDPHISFFRCRIAKTDRASSCNTAHCFSPTYHRALLPDGCMYPYRAPQRWICKGPDMRVVCVDFRGIKRQ
jgi:hypothetical protein